MEINNTKVDQETLRKKHEELIEQATAGNKKLLNDLGDMHEVLNELPGMMNGFKDIASQYFMPIGKKTTTVDGRPAVITLLKGGSVLVDFINKEHLKEFYDAH